jgi:hypothetical protein
MAEREQPDTVYANAVASYQLLSCHATKDTNEAAR